MMKTSWLRTDTPMSTDISWLGNVLTVNVAGGSPSLYSECVQCYQHYPARYFQIRTVPQLKRRVPDATSLQTL